LGTLGFKKAIMKIYHKYKEIASKIPDTRSEAVSGQLKSTSNGHF
jgi:hypothetical protein